MSIHQPQRDSVNPGDDDTAEKRIGVTQDQVLRERRRRS
jgi:hypothetical protein